MDDVDYGETGDTRIIVYKKSAARSFMHGLLRITAITGIYYLRNKMIEYYWRPRLTEASYPKSDWSHAASITGDTRK